MARFGRSYPMPHGGYFLAGTFGEEISQTVVLESDESNQILNSLTMTINSALSIDIHEPGSTLTVNPSGLDMGMAIGTLGINIFEPVDSGPIFPGRVIMAMDLNPVTPETVSFELPPGKWKKPKKNLPRRRPWNTLGEYEDTEYDVGIDFAPIVARSGWWAVSSLTLRDSIVIRSEASISQDPTVEGKP